MKGIHGDFTHKAGLGKDSRPSRGRDFSQIAFTQAFAVPCTLLCGVAVIPIEDKTSAVVVGLTWDAKVTTLFVGSGRCRRLSAAFSFSRVGRCLRQWQVSQENSGAQFQASRRSDLVSVFTIALPGAAQ